MTPNAEKTSRVRAILFDMSHTITQARAGVLDIHREAAYSAGFDTSDFSDEQLEKIFETVVEFIIKFQNDNKVGIHWGEQAEDWLDANRVFVEAIGYNDATDTQLMIYEKYWKDTLSTNWESLVEGAKETLEELKNRGYILGVCTRRYDNPEQLFKNWGVHQLLSTIQYSAVLGYAKPSPFTLLKAAEEIGINPRLCAYVGNYVHVDVDASLSAEMLPILTVWSDSKERDLAPESAIVIDKINELLDLFPGPPS
ncbi:MAG: HAD hydrolase-like protein [Candidatus Thorarchaeota archaeon]